MAEPGYIDTTDITDLRTEIIDAVEFYNQQSRDWRALLATQTTDTKVRELQENKDFRKAGSDTSRPERQELAYAEIDLPEPQKYTLGSAVTQEALEQGLKREMIDGDHAANLEADFRLIAEVILEECLSDGGWYDASVAPPRFKSNSFTSSHDHYLYADTAGVPALAHFAEMKRHIHEHGFGRVRDGGSLIAFINGDQAEQIEGVAEWDEEQMATSVMDTLQRLGLTPSFQAAGVPVTVEDWVPEYYGLCVDAAALPIRWRNPRGTASDGGLIVFEEGPNFQYYVAEEYRRYCSAKIVKRGAGVAYYWNGSSWSDASISPGA